MESRDAVLRFLRQEFQREVDSGFAWLERIPDTQVRKFLDYYRGLPPDESMNFGRYSGLKNPFGGLLREEQSKLIQELNLSALGRFISGAPNPYDQGTRAVDTVTMK